MRIACTRSNISASEPYRSCGIPYSASAFGVLPPLWSRAAKKPFPDEICSRCVLSTPEIVAASRPVSRLRCSAGPSAGHASRVGGPRVAGQENMAVQKAELVGDDGFVFDAVVDVEVVDSRIDAQFAMRGAAGSLDRPELKL